jgi:hypothetical protein
MLGRLCKVSVLHLVGSRKGIGRLSTAYMHNSHQLSLPANALSLA